MPSYPRNAYDVDDIEEAELRRLERGRSPETRVVDLDDDALTKNGGHASVAAFAPHVSISTVGTMGSSRRVGGSGGVETRGNPSRICQRCRNLIL